jgi:nucleotide-binding universal stress UspA family protein
VTVSIRRIVVPVETADAGSAALKAAIAIAAECGATVDALHIRERPQVPPGEYYPLGAVVSEEFLNSLEQAAAEKAARLKTVFDETVRSTAAASGAPATRWIERAGAAPFDVGAAARVADVVVFSKTQEPAKFREE